MAQKQKKSAQELAEIIKARLGLDGVHITVFPAPPYGWAAKVNVGVRVVNTFQQQVERLVPELSAEYDLAT